MDYIVSLYVTKFLNIMFYFMYVSFDKLDKALFFLYGTVFLSLFLQKMLFSYHHFH